MDTYSIEELARAVMREREDEVRRLRPRTSEHHVPMQPLRSRLARALFHLALRLDAGVIGGLASALTLGDRRKSSRV